MSEESPVPWLHPNILLAVHRAHVLPEMAPEGKALYLSLRLFSSVFYLIYLNVAGINGRILFPLSLLRTIIRG